jgi:hypothetical protein
MVQRDCNCTQSILKKQGKKSERLKIIGLPDLQLWDSFLTNRKLAA